VINGMFHWAKYANVHHIHYHGYAIDWKSNGFKQYHLMKLKCSNVAYWRLSAYLFKPLVLQSSNDP